MRPVSPVLPGHEELIKEVIVAENQEEYLPLPSIIVPGPDGEVLTRWEMSNEEKVLLLSGGHIYLSLWTFGGPVQPILLRVSTPDMVIDEQRKVELPRNDIKVDIPAKEDSAPN